MTTGSRRDPSGAQTPRAQARGADLERDAGCVAGLGMNVNSLFSHLSGEVIALLLEGAQAVLCGAALSRDLL
jgi:hypothetical protein